eukprot:UN28303
MFNQPFLTVFESWDDSMQGGDSADIFSVACVAAPSCSDFEDPCDCTGECGWDGDSNSCMEGSNTSCAECETSSESCITGSCAAFSDGSSCPTEYNELLVCQCDEACDQPEHSNCCEDFYDECTAVDCSSIEDPCDCTGECGWDGDSDSCMEGSNTSCNECETIDGNCITGSCAAFSDDSSCPTEYNELLVCQCNDECDEHGNCCEDVAECGVDCSSFTDPCDCTGECGWDGDSDSCMEGSNTSCAECETIDENCITGSCELFDDESMCQMEYNPLLVCQCNWECEEHDNCCEDVESCRFSKVGDGLCRGTGGLSPPNFSSNGYDRASCEKACGELDDCLAYSITTAVNSRCALWLNVDKDHEDVEDLPGLDERADMKAFSGKGDWEVGVCIDEVFEKPKTTCYSKHDDGCAVDVCGSIEDPCDCTGECGWDGDSNSCMEGSNTSCNECETIDENCITGSCAEFSDERSCPTEYDEFLVCQCNDECDEHDNCCEDVDQCEESTEPTDGTCEMSEECTELYVALAHDLAEETSRADDCAADFEDQHQMLLECAKPMPEENHIC